MRSASSYAADERVGFGEIPNAGSFRGSNSRAFSRTRDRLVPATLPPIDRTEPVPNLRVVRR